MPPTREMIEKAVECLGETRLVHFGADKSSVKAGETVTVSWDVDVPATCGLSVRLNHGQVPRKGSRTIHPVRSVFYRLDCGAAGVSQTLGTVGISVDTSGCVVREIPEDLVRPEVLASVDQSLAEYNADPKNKDHPVSKRKESVVEIEPSGIVLRLRLKLAIDNFFDPDVDVDARIDIGMSPEGQVLAVYKSFAVDVDWPWWVTGITLGITKIVEEFMDGAVEGAMKQKILNDLRRGFQNKVDAFPGTAVDLGTAQDAVLVTLCQDRLDLRGLLSVPSGHDLVLDPA
ncbi:MAG: hypothetical protein JST30_05420 [Armatimonadetes bacterium]|nr:hypothetical protein [Armatimonadota bacterium]